jgi:hypothetical protein
MNPDPLLAAAISRITKEINNRMFEIREQLDAVAKSYNQLERDIESLDSYCKQYYEQGNQRLQKPLESQM